ncbi:MAG: ABC transporter permease [Gulosibacter sp.]|uniref:ABC transporter permease n=1 Tax=Gulosibacter sp. TaxID=2817531 RepID=UPI003F92C828
MSDYATAPISTEPAAPSAWQRVVSFSQKFPLLQLLTLLAVILWAFVTMPALASPVGIASIFVLASLLGIAAMGQTFVVLLGGLDLAVPGYIAVGAFSATVLAGTREWPLILAIFTGMLIAAVAGALTGAICHRYRIQPLVITLGSSAVLTGGVIFLTGGNFTAAPPATLGDFTRVNATTLGLPIPPVVVLWIVLAILVAVFLARTTAGRRLYATAGNPQAATLARVKTGRVWTAAFAVNGALSALAGALIAGFSAGSSATIGDPYLFTGLAAVLIGGTTFGSIRGNYTRTFIGALLLTLLSTIMIGQGFTEGQSRILYGVIIIVVLAIYGRDRRLRDRF